MKTEDLRNAYQNPPEDFHNALIFSLCKLEEKPRQRYKSRRRAVKISAVCAAVVMLGSVTAAAAATDFFGLFSQPVGKFGLRVGVTEDTTESADKPLKPVKINFGYMTEGFEPIPNTDGMKYSFGGNGEIIPSYSFWITPSKDYDYTEEYIIDSEETVVNGRKLILTARQIEEGGPVDYGAIMYFEDWGYVVGAGAYDGAEKQELMKIMRNLNLEEDKDYVPETIPEDMIPSKLDLKRREYDWKVSDDFTIHKAGEAFEWGRELNSNDFTVKVTSIREQSDTEGIPEESFNWTTDYSIIYSDYFDENGSLITPYTRRLFTQADGINTQRRTWDAEDDRHFFVVTVEVTQNTDEPFSSFDVFSDMTPVILLKDEDGSYHHNGEEDNYGVVQNVLYGDVQTVCSTPGDDINTVSMKKGETRVFTYGIVVDDDVLDNAYLRFNSESEEKIDDSAEMITLNFHNDCVKIKD